VTPSISSLPRPGSAVSRLLLAFGLAGALAAATPVTLQLKYFHQFQFAGYYAAQDRGYYREAGLDVRIAEGAPGLRPAEEVASDRAQYGVADSSLLLAWAAGTPVVVLGVVFQHSPAVLLVRRQGAEGGMQALAGRRVMMGPEDAEITAFLRREGLPPERLAVVPHSFRIQDFIDGRVDAYSAYLTSEPYHLDRAGVLYQAYPPRSAAIDFYGDNLFTSEKELHDHPDRVKAFRAASLRGWQYAMEHPEEVVDLILRRYGSRSSRGQLLYEAQQTATLLQADQVELGYMNPNRWRRIADTYAELGMIAPGLPLTGFEYRPAPPPDLTWLLWAAAAALAMGIGGFTWQVHRANARLRQELGERRRAEQALQASDRQLRTMLRTAMDAVWLVDSEGRIREANDTAGRMLGMTRRDLLGTRVADIDAVPEPEAVAGQLARIRARGYDVFPMVHRRRDGSTFPVEIAATYQPDSGQFVAYVRDVTERRQAEQVQRNLETELLQAQKMESLGSLAGGVAHDMNNVLAAIQAVTQTLVHARTGDRDLMAPLATIEKAAERGRDLVKGLTDFARKDLREPEWLDLNALVRDEADILRRTTLQKVDLVLDLQDPLPAVQGERGPLAGALMNLCVNAVDAMPRGGTLTLRTLVLAEGQVGLEVADTGEGMSRDVQEHALEPFFTTKPFGRGTGLGLASVYATVKAHGGTVAIQSELGRGTSVRVQLPAGRRPEAPAPAQRPDTLATGSLRILLVDDDELIRESVPELVAYQGHRVEVAPGGREALKLLKAGLEVDMVILDQNMPGMTGTETLAGIRRLRPGLPVLLATGHLEEEVAAVLRADGRALSLAKPFTLAELGRRLEEVGALAG
jgi:PAS domain S-box-containing protein